MPIPYLVHGNSVQVYGCRLGCLLAPIQGTVTSGTYKGDDPHNGNEDADGGRVKSLFLSVTASDKRDFSASGAASTRSQNNNNGGCGIMIARSRSPFARFCSTSGRPVILESKSSH
jgi:hypothetical protein